MNPTVRTAAAIALLAAPALAQDPTLLTSEPVSISLQPAEAPAASAATGDSKPSAPEAPLKLAYGAEGSQWLWAGYGVADNFEDSVDQYVYLAWSTFLAQDVELGLEAGLWHFNQPGDNEGGLSGSILFRWHFIHRETWTAYAMGGIGALGATGEVPDGGTSFDLLPRLGLGVTKQLTDDGLRLDVGVRWHHISNARINGDDDNPSRDSAMLYVGLIFPF
ncbi:MAG TPA: acyloxyacyl hydrolase [Phycisphaerales bacterium]|nr:acyloxyacyl hydrolase [Phycisphaerales bacterium]